MKIQEISELFLFVFVSLIIYQAECNINVQKRDTDFLKEANMIPLDGSSNSHKLSSQLIDAIHGVKMGISSDDCDNGIDNLKVDWDGSPVNYTCYHPKDPLPIIDWLEPLEKCDLPKGYFPKHMCMTDKLSYDDPIPTHGNHRPLWPMYGEYTFVPPQRWLHTLEHGGIVMLYHPCTEPLEVQRLRRILKNCLRRYVITPHASLPVNRPLALVSWGCKLMMNNVDKQAVIQFIKKNALHAPEGKLAKEGQYSYKLIERSYVVPGSNFQDAKLCPHF